MSVISVFKARKTPIPKNVASRRTHGYYCVPRRSAKSSAQKKCLRSRSAAVLFTLAAVQRLESKVICYRHREKILQLQNEKFDWQVFGNRNLPWPLLTVSHQSVNGDKTVCFIGLNKCWMNFKKGECSVKISDEGQVFIYLTLWIHWWQKESSFLSFDPH